jgi:hypothetical protein
MKRFVIPMISAAALLISAAALLISAAALLISACSSEDEVTARTSEQGGEAAGEVLGGTISDDMIALEQLRSQAPLAPRQKSEAASGSDRAGDAANDEAEAAPAAPAPSEAPAAE